MRTIIGWCGAAIGLALGAGDTPGNASERGTPHAPPRRAAVTRIGGCSGVCVHPAGIVLTAKHCTLGEQATVTLPGREPVVARRLYVGPDAEDVVAYLLPIDAWPALALAQAVPAVGADVWSGGYPERGGVRTFRSARGRITGGGVHELRRGGALLGRFLANDTDLVTGPGWSGGPLLDERGRVIGLLSAGNRHGSAFVSLAATRQAFDTALATLQARERPHLLAFGYDACPHCRSFRADVRAGRFERFEVEYVDVTTLAGRRRYDALRAALAKATGTMPPDGFPAFHVAGRAAMTVGYGAANDGWPRLLEWLRETLRLPVTGFDAVTGRRDPGASPDPGPPDASTPDEPGESSPDPGVGDFAERPASPFPSDDEPLPWWAMVAGSVVRLIEERLTRGLYGANGGEEVSA